MGEKKAANAWGLFDVHGNVWEWCQDWYGPLSAENITDPENLQSGAARVLRGGSWCGYAENCRAADRYGFAPGDRYQFDGLRVCFRLD